MIFGIFDFFSSAVILTKAIIFATNIDWTAPDAKILTLLSVLMIFEAVLIAIFAACLLYGACAKKWRCLLAYCFWQVTFNEV